jgi:hypothetical protein
MTSGKNLGHPLLRERTILTVLLMIHRSIFNSEISAAPNTYLRETATLIVTKKKKTNGASESTRSARSRRNLNSWRFLRAL